MSGTSPLLAIALALCLGLGACSQDSDPADGEGATGGSPKSSEGATPPADAASGEDAAADTEPIMVGENRHRPACQLFTPTDAVEMLPFTGEGEFTEEALTASVPLADRPAKNAIEQAMGEAACSYSLGDGNNTSVELKVKEYADRRAAHSQWNTIRELGEEKLPKPLRGGGTFSELDAAMLSILADAAETVGGVRIPGIDDRILWRTGSSQFIATVDNLVLTFDLAENYGVTSMLTKRDAALAERVLVRAMDRAEDPATPTSPVPPLFTQDEDWPLFLDPCTLLDEEAAETLLGQPTTMAYRSSVDFRPDVNLRVDSPAGRSHDNSCEREPDDRRGAAELTVQYVAPQDTAEDVLYSHIANAGFQDTTPSRRQIDQIRGAMIPGNISDVDASYILALSQEGSSTFRSYLLVDRYVLELSAYLPQGKFGRRSVDTATLTEGTKLVADHLVAAIADGSTS